MIDRKKFFDGVRQNPFSGKLNKGQVEGCSAIIDEFEAKLMTDYRDLAYMLATSKWETDHTMQPIKEGGGLKYLKSKKYWPWYGRGLVQLTWEANYKKMGKLIGVDLIADPDAALDMPIAVKIMFEGMIHGHFTGKKLSDYFNSAKTDWIGARRIINGTDRAAEIANIAKAFYADIVLAA